MNFVLLFRHVALAILLAGTIAANASPLPEAVKAGLAKAGIPTDAASVWVQAVDADRPQLAHQGERPMNPASVMKVVTAFAALERLGPAYTWTTRISTVGRIEGGVLDGSLYVTGGADPMLTHERIWKLLRQVRSLGITTVRGDIVLDGSALALPPHDPAAFDGRALRPYNSGASGLLMHFNTLQLRLVPGAEPGAPVALAAAPALTGLAIDNRITSEAGPCGLWYGKLAAALEPDEAGLRLVLSGSLPSSCGQRDWATAPLSPEQFARALVAGLWAELGGGLEGTVRSGLTPPEAVPLLSDTSPPLSDVVREMNKWSSNVIARQLLATLGKENGAGLDMIATGSEFVRALLSANAIPTQGLVIENGSGLSRIERVSARTLADVLLTAWRRSYMPEFVAALPIAGEDGTARGRLNESPARGHAHIKTGSINGVKSLAGYVLDRRGRRHVVVVMVNHPDASASQQAQDAVLEWVWATGGEAERR